MLLIDEFVQHSLALNLLAPRTCEEYKKECQYFWMFLCKERNVELTNDLILSVQKSDMLRYLVYCNKKNNSASTKARKISACKSFYQYLAEYDYLPFNPIASIRRPRIPHREVVSLNLVESIRLIDQVKKSARNDFYSYRNNAIITVLFNCGLRVSELASLRISKLSSNQMQVIGKGNKERPIPLNTSVVKSISNYLKVRNSNSDFLFVRSDGQPLSAGAITIITKGLIRAAGLSDDFTAHKLRHTCASFMFNYGNVPLRVIQQILGHTSVSTTELYVHTLPVANVNAVNSNPLSLFGSLA